MMVLYHACSRRLDSTCMLSFLVLLASGKRGVSHMFKRLESPHFFVCYRALVLDD